MRKKRLNFAAAAAMTMMLLASVIGCSQSQPESPGQLENPGTVSAEGGVLCLRVNPEIAIAYDADGNVTAVSARNEDAKAILANYTGFEGKACRDVVSDLVVAIGDAGYFVEEIEGKNRQITIEIEPGSKLPNDVFLDEVVADVREYVNSQQWNSLVELQGEAEFGQTDYGKTDYDDTDYGPNNDGVTDFGKTDYDDTDYGPNSDGVTDFGKTDYDATDYGQVPAQTQAPAADKAYGKTDYGKTDYGKTDYEETDYGKTDYGKTDYGKTDYDATDYDATDYR